MLHPLVAHRGALSRLLFAVTLLGLLGCAVGAAYAATVWGSRPAALFLLAYVAPLCLAGPWWVRDRLDAITTARDLALPRLALDITVFVLALARFGIGERLPFSGHMLFLVYSGLTAERLPYRWLALALILETTVFKLTVWRDPTSWSLGLGLGVAAALLARAPTFREAVP